MQIKRLRIAGFKSFVDPADLRIEPGLTGVVGPNGCGKSNLLEALRWTMGEGSAKSLRGAGMEDVIFAGTATRPPRDFAEVSILADIDGDETEVVRRIERGAGSAYRIDGRDVRARDVALLFADAATGAHSPALVSQGRIGAVIAAKPADRRAMLEEAAGIAGLHVRRSDAEQRLRATEANLARLDTIIADQDARAAALKRQARAAERYRTISDQIRIAEARMIFARWRDAVAAADAARGRSGGRRRTGRQRDRGERGRRGGPACGDRDRRRRARRGAGRARPGGRGGAPAGDAQDRIGDRRAPDRGSGRRCSAGSRTTARAKDRWRAMPPRRWRGWRRRWRRSTAGIATDAAALPGLDAALAEAERVGARCRGRAGAGAGAAGGRGRRGAGRRRRAAGGRGPSGAGDARDRRGGATARDAGRRRTDRGGARRCRQRADRRHRRGRPRPRRARPGGGG